jgi:hypothetical protein
VKIVDDTVHLKLVFFGTALAGKTTIMEWLFCNAVPQDLKIVDQIRQVKTSFGQTLLFDFVPIKLNEHVVVRLYTVTGQDYYQVTRPQIVSGADGVFLVIDSQPKELEHNRELVQELMSYRGEIEGLDEADVVVFLNKQDVEDAHPPEYLLEELGISQWPFFATSAITGQNLAAGFLEMLTRVTGRFKAQGIELT